MHFPLILLCPYANNSFTDENGTRKTKQLTVNDVWDLPPTQKVVVDWNSEGQPIGDGGGLLNRFLGPIARDLQLFLISYPSWKKLPKDYKEDAFKDNIQVRVICFRFIP